MGKGRLGVLTWPNIPQFFEPLKSVDWRFFSRSEALMSNFLRLRIDLCPLG